MVASAVDHAQLSALFQLFLRETLSTLSTLTLASIAVLAQLSALYQPSLRAKSKRQNKKKTVLQVYLEDRLFFYSGIWRSQMNEEMRSIFECDWAQPCGACQLSNAARLGTASLVPRCRCFALRPFSLLHFAMPPDSEPLRLFLVVAASLCVPLVFSTSQCRQTRNRFACSSLSLLRFASL